MVVWIARLDTKKKKLFLQELVQQQILSILDNVTRCRLISIPRKPEKNANKQTQHALFSLLFFFFSFAVQSKYTTGPTANIEEPNHIIIDLKSRQLLVLSSKETQDLKTSPQEYFRAATPPFGSVKYYYNVLSATGKKRINDTWHTHTLYRTTWAYPKQPL